MQSSLSQRFCVPSRRPRFPSGRSLRARKSYLRSVPFAAVPVTRSSQSERIHCGPPLSSRPDSKPKRQVDRSQQAGNLCLPGTYLLRLVQVTCAAGSASSNPPVQVTSASISEPARKNLTNAAAACRRFGWLSFWTQLVLSVVSAIILLFSVAFTSMVRSSIGWAPLLIVVLLNEHLCMA